MAGATIETFGGSRIDLVFPVVEGRCHRPGRLPSLGILERNMTPRARAHAGAGASVRSVAPGGVAASMLARWLVAVHRMASDTLGWVAMAAVIEAHSETLLSIHSTMLDVEPSPGFRGDVTGGADHGLGGGEFLAMAPGATLMDVARKSSLTVWG